MKVAHILRRFDKSDWGGIETVCLNLCKELIKLDLSVEILSTKAMSTKSSELYDDVPVKRFSYFYPYISFERGKKEQFDRKGGNPFSVELINYLKESMPDLIHLHTMGFLGAQVIRFANHHNIPVVTSLHGGHFDIEKVETNSFTDLYKKTISYARLLRPIFDPTKILDKSNGIICVGNNEAIKAKESLPNKLITYIPNGVNTELFEGEKEPDFYPNLLKINPEKKVLLYQSRIDGQKNQNFLIDIAIELQKINCLDSYHFFINGPVMNEEYYQNMKSRAMDLNISQYFSFERGFKPESREHIQSFLNAEAFLFPTIHEPFGIVALEAWASKLPVISSARGGLKYFLKHEKNALIAPLDSPSEWANQITNLDKLKRDHLINNAYREVKESFSWKKCAQSSKDFYSRL